MLIVLIPIYSCSPDYHNVQHWARLEQFSRVPMVCSLYLNLDHATSVFSLPFDNQRSSNSLQHLTHSHISISHVSILSFSQYHHFRIHFMDNKFKKINKCIKI
jgi:hypothetical protein